MSKGEGSRTARSHVKRRRGRGEGKKRGAEKRERKKEEKKPDNVAT
jgi:hypothetical protein